MSTLVHRGPVNSSISNPQLLQGRELVAGRFPHGVKGADRAPDRQKRRREGGGSTARAAAFGGGCNVMQCDATCVNEHR